MDDRDQATSIDSKSWTGEPAPPASPRERFERRFSRSYGWLAIGPGVPLLAAGIFLSTGTIPVGFDRPPITVAEQPEIFWSLLSYLVIVAAGVSLMTLAFVWALERMRPFFERVYVPGGSPKARRRHRR